MNSDFFNRILAAVSIERFDAYRQHDNADEVTALGRYLWNIAVSEALYSPLQMAEVALRNAAHRAFTGYFKTPSWYDMASLTNLGKQDVQKPRTKLIKSANPEPLVELLPNLASVFGPVFSINSTPGRV